MTITIYTSNPNSNRGLAPGYIHVCISALQPKLIDKDPAFFDKFEKYFNDSLQSTLNRCNNKLHIIAKHPVEPSGDDGERFYPNTETDHVHIHYWHSRNCAVTSSLWGFIGLNGYTGTYATVNSCFSSFKYIYQKGRRNRISMHLIGHESSGRTTKLAIERLEGADPGEPEWTEKRSNALCEYSVRPGDGESDETATTSHQTEVLPRNHSGTKAEGVIQFVNFHIQESQAVDNCDFDAYFSQMEITEQPFIQHVLFKHKYKQYKTDILDTINMMHQKYQMKKWEDLWEVFKESAWERRGISFTTPAEGAYWIKRLLSYNSIPVADFVKDVYDVINRNKQKRNILMFVGPPSSGKSFLVKSIIRSCSFTFITNKLNCRSSEFALSDMPTKRVAMFDEPIITEDWFETFKLLSAGEPCLTNIKFGGHVTIPRIPILVASNYMPWINMPPSKLTSSRDAILARGPIYELNNFPELRTCERDLHPLAWAHLVREYVHCGEYEAYQGDSWPYPNGELLSTIDKGTPASSCNSPLSGTASPRTPQQLSEVRGSPDTRVPQQKHPRRLLQEGSGPPPAKRQLFGDSSYDRVPDSQLVDEKNGANDVPTGGQHMEDDEISKLYDSAMAQCGTPTGARGHSGQDDGGNLPVADSSTPVLPSLPM